MAFVEAHITKFWPIIDFPMAHIIKIRPNHNGRGCIFVIMGFRMSIIIDLGRSIVEWAVTINGLRYLAVNLRPKVVKWAL